MLATLGLLTVGATLGATPWSLVATPPDPVLADLDLTMQARRRLQEDGLLAPWNLGVRVRGRVAVLWGPTPSVEMGLLAEARVRTMIELIDVRNELVVVPEDIRDVAPAPGERPFFLPEKGPPPLPDAPRPFLKRNSYPAWHGASAQR